MDKSIPAPAAKILDVIGYKEAPKGYDTIYGNNQNKLPKQITEMTLDELILNQSEFTRRFKSSASGRYQFMRATLLDLKKTEKLSGREKFTPDFQDRLGYALLRRRGYDAWVAGKISHDAFMIGIAKEWASFPVPYDMQGAHKRVMRGQSYYAGDALNKSLIDPGTVWNSLVTAYAMRNQGTTVVVEAPKPTTEQPSIIVTPEDPTKKFVTALLDWIASYFKKEA